MPILDDLLSRSENLDGDLRFSFGSYRPWLHSFHDALAISLASFSAFTDDWRVAFDQQATEIPGSVPRSFLPRVLSTLRRWSNSPDSYDAREHETLDRYVLHDVLDDGALGTNYPGIPPVVHALCYGSLYLARMTEDFRVGIHGSFHDLLAKNDSGLMPDAVGQLLIDGLPLTTIQLAVQDYGG